MKHRFGHSTSVVIASGMAVTIAAFVWLYGARTRGLRDDTPTTLCADASAHAPSEPHGQASTIPTLTAQEQIGRSPEAAERQADVAADQATSHGDDGAGARTLEPVSPPATESNARHATPPAGAWGATADDPATPVIMSDYQTWTVIGAAASMVDSNRIRFSGGVGIADRNGNWITADQGDVVRSNGAISGLSLTGNASVRARPKASMADFRKTLELLNAGKTREISVRVGQ